MTRSFFLTFGCLVTAASLLCAEPAQETADYLLDDAGGTSFALYPGGAYRSLVREEDMVSSLEEMKQRLIRLPAGVRIRWIPAAAPGMPVLLSDEGALLEFKAFCLEHRIELVITPGPCRTDSQCDAYCEAMYTHTECRIPGGICTENVCACETPVCR
jgi:hypothetical protein